MHFASHLRSERLGEFTVGTALHRSESLALVQLLVLYHLVTAAPRSRWAATARGSCKPPRAKGLPKNRRRVRNGRESSRAVTGSDGIRTYFLGFGGRSGGVSRSSPGVSTSWTGP